jgi:acylphosphatase
MTQTRVIARRLVIRGRVQGVGFRYSLREEALRRGVAGWTRNRRDGTVEAVVQGEQGDVDRVIEWARRGPPSAEVAAVEIDEEAIGDYDGFETRPTV